MSFIVSVTRSITLMLLGLGTCLLWDYQTLTFAQDLFEGSYGSKSSTQELSYSPNGYVAQDGKSQSLSGDRKIPHLRVAEYQENNSDCPKINAITDSSLSDYLKDNYQLDYLNYHYLINPQSRINLVEQEALAKFTLLASQRVVHDYVDNAKSQVLINNHGCSFIHSCFNSLKQEHNPDHIQTCKDEEGTFALASASNQSSASTTNTNTTNTSTKASAEALASVSASAEAAAATDNALTTNANDLGVMAVTAGQDSALVAHSNNAVGAYMSKTGGVHRRFNDMAEQSLAAVVYGNDQALSGRAAGAAAHAGAGAAGNGDNGAGVVLFNIKITDAPKMDNHAFTEAAYHSIDHLKGLEVNASTLQNMLDSLSVYYQDHGFALARAYLPAQTIDNGVVDVVIANPKFNNFNIENKSLVSDDYLAYLMSGITDLSGKDVTTGELDSQIRKLADLGTFSMLGEANNADPHGLLKDIDFTVAPTQDRFSFALFADNEGNKSAGRYRFGGLVEIQSPTGSADRLLLSYARSNEKQNNYSLSYLLPINSHPTVMGLDLCYSDYELSGFYRELGAQGTSLSVDAYVIEPVVRTENSMFNLKAGVRYRDLIDEYRNFDLEFKKHTWSGYAGFSGFNYLGDWLFDHETKLLATRVYCDDEWGAVEDRTYLTLEGKVSLGYKFTDEWYARTALTYQMANQSPDGSDTFLAGGSTGLRAYEFGDISGDGGVVWKNELKYFPSELPELSLTAHIETAHVYNHDYVGETASSAGLTANVSFEGLKLELDMSHGLGTMPVFAEDQAAIKFNVSYTCQQQL